MCVCVRVCVCEVVWEGDVWGLGCRDGCVEGGERVVGDGGMGHFGIVL